MTLSHRRLAFTALLAAALLLTLPGCDPDQPRVLLTRASPAPTPSTARVVPTATAAASPTVPPPSPTAAPTRTPTPPPAPSPTSATGLAVTPVPAPPTATPTAAPTAVPTAVAARVHVVRYGETLAGIAWEYGTTAAAISRLNGLANANRIYAGQRLLIP